MKCKLRNLALATALASLSLASHAEVIKLKLAPGLWEETRVTLINGQNVEESLRKAREKMMARMTPEERKIMEESQGNRGANGAMQSCLTPAQVAKGIDTETFKRKMEESSQGCTLDIISASPAGAKFKAVCMGPQGANYKGTGEYTVASSKEWHFKMVADGKVTGPNGAPLPQGSNFQASQEVHARWKGANCGNVASREDDADGRGQD